MTEDELRTVVSGAIVSAWMHVCDPSSAVIVVMDAVQAFSRGVPDSGTHAKLVKLPPSEWQRSEDVEARAMTSEQQVLYAVRARYGRNRHALPYGDLTALCGHREAACNWYNDGFDGLFMLADERTVKCRQCLRAMARAAKEASDGE